MNSTLSAWRCGSRDRRAGLAAPTIARPRLLAGCASPDWAVVMSKTTPANTKAGQESSSFAAAIPLFLGSGIIVVDSQQKISALTNQSAQILALDAPLSPGSSLQALPAPLAKIALDTLTSGKPVSGLEIELKRGQRERIVVGVSAVPNRLDKKITGVVLAINDVSSARELRETLWRIDRLANIGTLAAGMAHEIKNALVAGKTFIDLLLEKNRDVELVEVVRRELARIDAIVTRILKFAGPDRTTTHPVSVHEILEHSLRLVQPHREDKLISLNQSLRADLDVVEGDDYQLQQAFVNLLLNALEAMGPNGTLTVTTEGAADGAARGKSTRHIHVTIEDTGEGIAPEHLDRVFEPFFTTKSEGTGLGLPITRRIIEVHHGTVTVNSQPKKGTTFRITLPIHAPAARGS